MYKIRSKKLTILLTLIFVLTIMLPLAGPASAATTYSVLTAPTVVPPVTSNLGTIVIDIDTLGAGTHTALISLPNSDYSLGVPVITVAKEDTPGNTTGTVTKAGYASNEFRIDLIAAALDTGIKVTVTLPNVVVPSDADGDIVATITGLAGQLTSGSVVVGKASSGAVTLSLVDTVTITEAGTGATAVQINISENSQYALKRVGDTLKFKLPNGFTWNAGAGSTMVRVNDGANVKVPANFTIGGDGDRTLTLSRNAACPLGKSIFRLSVGVNVDDSVARFGDVEVTVSGSSSYSPSKLTIGTYADYGVSVNVKTVETVLAGRTGQEIGEFEIKENAQDSLYTGRTITMQLPAGTKWATIPAPSISGGGPLVAGAISAVGTDGRTVKFTVTNPAGGGKGTITFENMEIDVAADFSGDVTVKIDGSAGASGTIVLAKAVAPIAASTNAAQVKIGTQKQLAGNIVITEGKKEALKRGKDLTLTLPAGVNFDGLPTVEVTGGDVEIDKRAISARNQLLTIPITGESAAAGTITISNIKYTVDRTVPEGPIAVEIAGDALDECNDPFVTLALVRPFYTVPFTGLIFPQNDVVATAINATTITPAPGDTKQSASFVIGSTAYTVAGVQATMDVAPYVKDGRTYLPVRYAGYALGVAEENIFWDNAAATATLIKGDRVVQFTVGKKAMLINGSAIALDVAPEVTNGRVMLPFRWIATAFGASVLWDGTTQTVTMEL